ncbi:hypothetical protein GCM10023322_43350 [Rugosimonospora acidiphila]|uniref:YCII-related domain-containing protein n=2 Tax=Rugosimonospora acidiphila TaxID=556531 RepID=A0ABP9S1A4_9ACTN
MRTRDAHLALGDEMVAAGRMRYGGAILDASGNMTGSMLVLDMADRAEVDAWLAVEPYLTGDVWRRVEVLPFRVGPSFVGLHP